MQPLYLEGAHPVRVELEEGPALAITRDGEATRLLPLALLSHIVTRGGNVQWDQSALLACAERDIPIFLADDEHHLIATFRANSQTPVQDWNRFMRLIEDPDGIDYYRQFMAAKKEQMQRDVSERWHPLPEMRMPGYHRAMRIIRSAIQADLEAELHRRGFRRRIALLREAGLDLGRDFLNILEPWTHWILNEVWKRPVHDGVIPLTQPGRRPLLKGYEKHADLIRDSIRALIISFLYWLAEADTAHITHGDWQS